MVPNQYRSRRIKTTEYKIIFYNRRTNFGGETMERQEQLLSALLIEMQYLRNELREVKSLLGERESVVAETAAPNKAITLDNKISLLLYELQIHSNLKGYFYIREAVKMLMNDSTIVGGGFGNALYPVLAKQFAVSPQNVERAIRHAIEVSYREGSSHPMYKYFPDNRPTVTQFLTGIAEKFKLEESAA
jgi:two-component system response regulator (stage 0 sporulation protein A)